jgi:uncharacterized membrane protein
MYTITVKIEGVEKRRRSMAFVHIIVGFFLFIKCFDLYKYIDEPSIAPVLPFILVATVSLYYGFFRKRFDITAKHNPALRFLQTVTFLIFGFFMYRIGTSIDYIGLFLWAFLTLILFFTEKKAFQETNIVLTEEGIKVPGSYRDHLVEWTILESVTVRHDFITFFHKGKKYLQYQVMQDLSELEVVKMNAFCKERIEQVEKSTG